MALGTKVSVYKEDAFNLKEAGQRLVNACHLHDPSSARPLLASSSKDVAEAVTKLLQKIRQEAQGVIFTEIIGD
jgi:GTP cyclohydrolase II